mmetsp:Transcript_20953/g.18473  ORF Transcript_20953/g.18473 Transcript_20953/m.18473 type:complete len:320 (+) Transcript_20953:33-992(+)
MSEASPSFQDAIHQMYDEVIQDIADIYDKIKYEMKDQRTKVMEELNVWVDIQSAKYDNITLAKSGNEKFEAIDKIYQQSRLNINSILDIDEEIESQNDISKIVYSMIRSKIYQDFNHKNPTKHVLNALQAVIETTLNTNNIDQYGSCIKYKFNKILNKLDKENMVCCFENVKLFCYDQNEWSKIDIGRMKLYRLNNSDLKFVVFQSQTKHCIVAFQPINIQKCDMKQPKDSFINWIASDWTKSGKYGVYLARFQNQDQATSLIQSVMYIKQPDNPSIIPNVSNNGSGLITILSPYTNQDGKTDDEDSDGRDSVNFSTGD